MGETITFLLDQDYGRKGSVFAPFYNVATATTMAMSRIAKTTQSRVIPMFFVRNKDNKGYTLKFMPALDNYPSDDPVADATRFNALVEEVARDYPEQYGWTYKRFNTRPEGEPKVYD
jgi:KDO2-lipid IV(A) lauroyltransferase